MENKKKITIFGATGSIGDSTLKLIEKNRNKFQIHGITANKNISKLIYLSKKFKPKNVVIKDLDQYKYLKNQLSGYDINIECGEKSIVELSKQKVDCVIAGISGVAGLSSVYTAAKSGQNIALANKEALIALGHLIMPILKKYKSKIIPIDSEHNAIFQCLKGSNLNEIDQIILTASGGPFLNAPINKLDDVKVEQALTHPKWRMGKKITIDSATMMNKGLELIEAYWLFGQKKQIIKAIIHPESIVHGLVSYVDGSLIAHLAKADMRVPISYALGFPKRLDWSPARLKIKDLNNLTFRKINKNKFPCFALANEVLGGDPSSAIVLNAANEIAVENFLNHKISFMKIPNLISNCLELNYSKNVSALDDIIDLDREIRQRALQILNV